MGKDLKGATLGNSFGGTDFGRPSSSGKWFARLNANTLIINSMMLTFPEKNKHLCENIIISHWNCINTSFKWRKVFLLFFFFYHQCL